MCSLIASTFYHPAASCGEFSRLKQRGSNIKIHFPQAPEGTDLEVYLEVGQAVGATYYAMYKEANEKTSGYSSGQASSPVLNKMEVGNLINRRFGNFYDGSWPGGLAEYTPVGRTQLADFLIEIALRSHMGESEILEMVREANSNVLLFETLMLSGSALSNIVDGDSVLSYLTVKARKKGLTDIVNRIETLVASKTTTFARSYLAEMYREEVLARTNGLEIARDRLFPLRATSLDSHRDTMIVSIKEKLARGIKFEESISETIHEGYWIQHGLYADLKETVTMNADGTFEYKASLPGYGRVLPGHESLSFEDLLINASANDRLLYFIDKALTDSESRSLEGRKTPPNTPDQSSSPLSKEEIVKRNMDFLREYFTKNIAIERKREYIARLVNLGPGAYDYGQENEEKIHDPKEINIGKQTLEEAGLRDHDLRGDEGYTHDIHITYQLRRRLNRAELHQFITSLTAESAQAKIDALKSEAKWTAPVSPKKVGMQLELQKGYIKSVLRIAEELQKIKGGEDVARRAFLELKKRFDSGILPQDDAALKFNLGMGLSTVGEYVKGLEVLNWIEDEHITDEPNQATYDVDYHSRIIGFMHLMEMERAYKPAKLYDDYLLTQILYDSFSEWRKNDPYNVQWPGANFLAAYAETVVVPQKYAGNNFMHANIIISLARLYAALDEPDQSERLLSTVIELAEDLSPMDAIKILSRLAVVFEKMKFNPYIGKAYEGRDISRQVIKRALEISQMEDMGVSKEKAAGIIAEALIVQGRLEEAGELLQNALNNLFVPNPQGKGYIIPGANKDVGMFLVRKAALGGFEMDETPIEIHPRIYTEAVLSVAKGEFDKAFKLFFQYFDQFEWGTASDSSAKSSSPVTAEETRKKAYDDLGGIDLNTIDLEHEGKGVNIQFDPAELQEIIDAGIDGFAPVIINITPLPSVLPLLGLSPANKEEELEVSRLN